MDELLLGFHLRVSPSNLDPWSYMRRKQYLLREDIILPLSVDQGVWPYSENELLLSRLFSEVHGGTLQENVPNGLFIFDVRSRSVIAAPLKYKDAFLVAITIIDEPAGVAERMRTKHHIQKCQFTTSEIRNAGWNCLGYDVADEWLKSGLVNCSYRPSEKVSLAKRFATSLNEFCLFNDKVHACNFRNVCDVRVKEHAPFAVFGIWAHGRP